MSNKYSVKIGAKKAGNEAVWVCFATYLASLVTRDPIAIVAFSGVLAGFLKGVRNFIKRKWGFSF